VERKRSGKADRTGRKLDEREPSCERRSQKTMERERIEREAGVADRERSGERGF